MNTIQKVHATAWVIGAALNKAMRDAERRYVLPTSTNWPRRWVYGHAGQALASTDLFGPIVIEVEADTHHEDQ